MWIWWGWRRGSRASTFFTLSSTPISSLTFSEWAHVTPCCCDGLTFPFASTTRSGSGTSTGSCHSTGPALWWFQYEASNPTSCGLWWRPASTLTDNVHHLSNGGYNIFSNFYRCSSEVGGWQLWTEFVRGSSWVLSIKSRRMRICASICAVLHYKRTKLVVGKKINVRGQPWDCLDNLVGFASASVPTDPRSLRSIVPFSLVWVSITVLYNHIW